jgi:hypothetical protein
MSVNPCSHYNRGHVWARADAYFEGDQPPTPTYREATLEGRKVHVDGRRFVACDLRGCEFLIGGTGALRFEHCNIVNCAWRLDGHALMAVEALRAVRHLCKDWGQEFVARVIAYINTPPGS